MRAADITLSGVKVGPEAVLAGPEKGLEVLEHVIDEAIAALAAEACGAMAAVTQATVEYLKTRQQFGQPLSKFQVLQHRLVDMSVSGEEARAVVHAALQALDDDAPGAPARGVGSQGADRARPGSSARRPSSCTAASA